MSLSLYACTRARVMPASLGRLTQAQSCTGLPSWIEVDFGSHDPRRKLDALLMRQRTKPMKGCISTWASFGGNESYRNLAKE